jgi:enoyl-CoA hydratase/carnithine racemase
VFSGKIEVLPPDKLMARAWELAENLARRPTLLLRYTRSRRY